MDLVWRASLESPGSGQLRGFADLQGLIDFLAHQAERQDEADPGLDAQSLGEPW